MPIYAYVASSGDAALSIFDVSDPTAPSLAGVIRGAGSPNYLNGSRSIYVSGKYAYVASSSDDALSIFDVSDPTAPTLAGVIRGAGSPNYLNTAVSVFVDTRGAFTPLGFETILKAAGVI